MSNFSKSSGADARPPLDVSTITRPDDALLTYYTLVALCSLIAFPFVFVPLLIRFKTLRYRFDESGVSMCWGFFFRREVYLTYGRLQDIHVTRNIVERWLGIAKLPIQTASGSSGATMRIEGIRNPETLRDHLYTRMRGARADADDSAESMASGDRVAAGDQPGVRLLREIRDELRCLNADGEA